MRRVLGLAAAVLALALTGCGHAATTPAAGPTATSSPAPEVSRPAHVRIPVLQVDANIIDLGLQPDGTMQVPPDAKDAGWYTGSPSPGEVGPAVLAAHVNWKGVDGPFAKLDQLKTGDRVEVEHDNGTVSTFEVYRVDRFPKDDYPSDTVYADTEGPELRMITCGGSFDAKAHSYRDNIVVFAKLA